MLKDHVQGDAGFHGFSGDQLHDLAREAGLIVRRTRSFSAAGFLTAMLRAVCSGNASYNRIASALGECEPRPLSRQAVHARMGAPAVTFLDAVLGHLAGRHPAAAVPASDKLFPRVLIQDSTQLRMHRASHKVFAGLDNKSGPTAGVKIDWKLDASGGTVPAPAYAAARVQDKTAGAGLPGEVEAGDLVIRDMGYFAIGDFKAIAAKGAWWISRLHGLVDVRLEDGTELGDFLGDGSPGKVDVPVFLGKERHPARLVAVRVPVEVAARRRAARREKSIRQGHQPSRRAMRGDGWTIHVTNISRKMMDADGVASAYRLRWEIEIKFRAWKQSTGIGKALFHISNEHHLRALVVTAMIYFTLTLKMANQLSGLHPGRELSFEKICGWISDCIKGMVSLALPPPRDIRHLAAERRKRPRLSHLRDSLI